jgi:hypothetical protein
MHEHLGQLCTMGLILRLTEDEMHGAADAVRVFGNEQRAFAGGNALCDVTPERNCSLVRQWTHETHRCATLDAISQHGRELIYLRLIERQKSAH